METKSLKKDHWTWELSMPFSSYEPEIFAQFIDPRNDFRSRMISHSAEELWYETKLYSPRLPPLVWTRFRDYSELYPLSYLWRKTDLQKTWQISSQLCPENPAIAKPYVYGKMRKGLWLRREVLVFEPLTHFIPLSVFLRENFEPGKSRNSFEDKKELIGKLVSCMLDIFKSGLLPERDSSLDDLFCRLDQDLRIVFRFPEKVKLTQIEHHSLVNFLAWLYLEMRMYLPGNYLLRFLRDFLQAQGLQKKQMLSILQEIFSTAEALLNERIQKLDRGFILRNSSFFRFEFQGARVFLNYSIDQNQVLELIPKIALLSRLRQKVRIRRIGEREMLESDLIAIPEKSRRRQQVSRAFYFSVRLGLENLPHQKPLVGIESPRGDFIIYQPLSSASMALNEYLARLLAEELSGKSWDRGFLLRLAHLILRLHERGLVYEEPQGDEIWVEELPDGETNFYFTHLERLRAVGQIEAEFAGKNLFEIFSSLPLSEPDSLVILEEYLRRSKKFKDFKKNFTEYLHLIRKAEPHT